MMTDKLRDYRDEADAYNHAKQWIWEAKKALSDELAATNPPKPAQPEATQSAEAPKEVEIRKLCDLIQRSDCPAWSWFPSNAEIKKLAEYLVGKGVAVQHYDAHAVDATEIDHAKPQTNCGAKMDKLLESGKRENNGAKYPPESEEDERLNMIASGYEWGHCNFYHALYAEFFSGERKGND